jgi:O-antigen/teichoic acid export membrane protein
LALSGSDQAPPAPPQTLAARLRQRVSARLGDGDSRLLQRLAGTVFLIRVVNAGLAYGSQILFARWMGSFEFGIYVYVWTWVLLIGQSLDLGLATAAQRFIPEYRERQLFDLLRGYLSGSRWLAFGIAVAVALVCAGLVWLLAPWIDSFTVLPLIIACVALPAYALANVQDGIARTHDWVGLALFPSYLGRQLLVTALMGGAWLLGFPLDAVHALALACLSIWLPTLLQAATLNRRLRQCTPAGPKRYDVRLWFATSLPILMAEGMYLLLMYADVLILQQFRSPEEVAVYYAAAKTLALVAFIYFSIAATTAHRFSALQAAGDRAGLAALLKQAINWTFWPSLAVTAVLLLFGRPILELFGPQYGAGYPLMFILAVGLLARAAIGPMERFLNMLGQQRDTALVYALAFGANVVLCLLLIPPFGATGAALAITAALILETVCLFLVAKRRLGFHVFVVPRMVDWTFPLFARFRNWTAGRPQP